MGYSGGALQAAEPAPRITAMTDPALAGRYAWLAGLIDPAPGERVVDLGCGESSVLGLVLPRLDSGLAVGIDSDAGALGVAKACVPGPGSRSLVVQADLTGPLPLTDASMDVVFSHDVPGATHRSRRLSP